MKMLRKTILQEFKSSFPRFISIAILLALGAFVLIGLKVTGSDMRLSGNDYFKEHKMADAQITSPVGFNKEDKDYIDHMKHVDKTEYSVYKDAVVSNSKKTIRLNEKTSKLSIYKTIEGHLPKNSDEIALSNEDKGKYKLGQYIHLEDSKGDQEVAGLKHHKYKVVGFVTSSDYMQKRDLGVTNVGKGQIDTFAVLDKSGFSDTTPNVAKIAYDNLKGASYSHQFEQQLQKDVDQNEPGLTKWAEKRQTEIKDDKKAQIKDGREKLKQQEAKIDEKKATLSQSKQQLDDNEAQLKQAKQQLDQMPAGPQKNQMVQQQQAQEKALNAKKEEWQKNSNDLKDAQEKAASKKETLDTQSQKINEMGDLEYQIQSRSDYNQGYNQYGESAKRIDILSNTFPIIFFAVAILVTFTTMSRMAEEKRTSMGVLRALGYTKFDSMKLFLIYGTSAALLGTIIGSIFGTGFLPRRIYQAYAANLSVPPIQTPPSWLWIIISLIFALLCTVAPSMYIAWQSLKENPKYLLIPKPPKAGSKVLLERIPFIWKRLSFNHKVTIRNLLRYKSRMFMTIIGILGCTALLITGFGMKDSLNGIIDNQYKKIIHYDVIGVYNPNASQKEKEDYQQAVDHLKGVKKQGTVYFETVTTKPKGLVDNQQVTMMVPKDSQSFNDFVTLRNPDNGKAMHLKKDGVAITQKLAKLGHYKVGDHIDIKDKAGKKHKVRIGQIIQMYAGHDIIMDSSYYNKTFDKKVTYNAKIINLKDRSNQNINKVSRDLNSQDAAMTAVQSNQSKTSINTILDGLDKIVLIIVVASSALSFVVLFTLTNINVSERTRELATLRVLGFYKRETIMYIYRETIILTIVGILFGFIGGYGLHHYIMSTLPPNNAMADLTLLWSNFAISTGLTLIFSFIVMLIMMRKISSIDMLGALNSVD
ncbi:FtsX-like permease family protein [Staphylococcus simulans]|uniref:FtsX-like permease family protein n=1 Tax=Staphylococcus simulans TaxID=1286 RepID=UPI000D027ED6|nr:ABC transporter permease [Staphylococcus simulans]